MGQLYTPGTLISWQETPIPTKKEVRSRASFREEKSLTALEPASRTDTSLTKLILQFLSKLNQKFTNSLKSEGSLLSFEQCIPSPHLINGRDYNVGKHQK